jgi:hypothetical protein
MCCVSMGSGEGVKCYVRLPLGGGVSGVLSITASRSSGSSGLCATGSVGERSAMGNLCGDGTRAGRMSKFFSDNKIGQRLFSEFRHKARKCWMFSLRRAPSYFPKPIPNTTSPRTSGNLTRSVDISKPMDQS